MGNCCYKAPLNTLDIVDPMGNVDLGDSDTDSDIYVNRANIQFQNFNETNQNQNNNENNYGTYLDVNPNIVPVLVPEENTIIQAENVQYPVPNNNEIPSRNDPNTIWSFSGEQCIICMDNPIQGAILNCGHLKFCVRCLHAMTENADETKEYLNYCPVCREQIRGFATFSPNFYYKY